jgi:CheY-specific phosphatase CheX
METINPNARGYLLATFVGAIGGGLIVGLAIGVIPKIMSRMMSGMMKNMIAQMGEGSCEPDEM